MTDPVLLELPSTLQTERLLLRPPQAGDGPALHDAMLESLPALRRFLAAVPWIAAEPTLQAAELRCRSAQADFIARRDLPFMVFDRASGALLGGVGLHRTVWATPKTEVGYWCRSSRTGQGIVREAVAALCAYAFTHLRAVRIELVTDEENTASCRIAENCGFHLEGTLRHAQRAPDGSLRSLRIYARLAADNGTDKAA